ncbi:MAG TPA: hypothetical protein VLA52_06220, partial [Thermohalobaculum sp.]|nr:hypothetical protein [Thermohalobaculum sp.]
SLLNRRRQEIHGRIFDVLQRIEGTMPSVLAQHAAEAGRLADAIRYGRIAAEQALRRPAYAEAIAHLETTLALIDRQPPSPEVERERKDLLLLSGQAQIAHFGYAHDTTINTYAEIERIARETGDNELLIEGLYGRWAGNYVPGRNPLALEIADSICEVSNRVDDSLARALGHRLRGTVLTMMGRTDEATAALKETERLYDPAQHGEQAARFGQDVGIAGNCYRIGVLTLEGRLDSAASLARDVVRDLDRVSHAHTAGYALGHLAYFLCAAEILPLGEDTARRTIEISERDRMPLWAALGHASQSMAHVHQGRDQEALPELKNALKTLKDLDFSVFRPMLLATYAIALARTGQFSLATAQLGEAQELVEENDARYSEAEVCRAEGHLLLAQGNKLSAEASFVHAIGRARDLGHLSWEMRAAEDLAKLMRESGRAAEGRTMLSAIHGRFKEGHSLPMLQRVAQVIAETV